MNTNMEAPRAVEQDNSRFSKFIVRSAAATLGTLLLAVAFLMATPRANAAMTVSTADQDFMLAAGQVNLTEIKLAEYAAQNGKRDDVKAFGRRMVKDHTAINEDLKALAAQKTVTLPDSLDAAHQKMVDKLMALTGSGFDKAYIAGMFNGHKKAIKAFKAESAETKDADVKSFADKSIPVLEEHLKLITAIKKVGKDEQPSRPPERLYGTWIAKDVDAKMGEVKIRLTFRREKNATLLAWSDIPFVGQVRDLKGSFSVHGDTISSEAIRDGKKATFSFEIDQLVLRFKSGKVVRFDRE